MAEDLKKFTAKELEEYNGKNGKPAYVAYKGKVYDFSQSDLWSGGEHMGMHNAGKDITEELELAPHGEEVLERVKLVGTLEYAGSTAQSLFQAKRRLCSG